MHVDYSSTGNCWHPPESDMSFRPVAQFIPHSRTFRHLTQPVLIFEPPKRLMSTTLTASLNMVNTSGFNLSFACTLTASSNNRPLLRPSCLRHHLVLIFVSNSHEHALIIYIALDSSERHYSHFDSQDDSIDLLP